MKTYNKNAAATASSPLQQTFFGKKQQSMLSSPYKEAIKSLVGRPLNSDTLLHYNTKSVVYSFNKVNNLYPLLTAQATEYLLKSLFRSMFSLISRPVYLIKHDKIIIRLFVFLSPKIDKYLDTSTIVQGSNLQSANSRRLFRTGKGGASLLYLKKIALGKFLKFKSLRPKAVEILKTQAPVSTTAMPPFLPLLSPSGFARPGRGGFAFFQGVALPFSLAAVREPFALKKRQGTGEDKLGSSFSPYLLLSAKAAENGAACGSALHLPLFNKNRVQEAASTASLVKGSQSFSALALQEQSPKRQESLGLGKEVTNLSGASPTYPYISWVSNFKNSLERLSVIFGKIFNKKVEFEIIKAQLPFQDSNILAQILGYNANKYKFRRMLKILVPRAVIKNPSKELTLDSPANSPLAGFAGPQGEGRVLPSYLSGMNIQLAGRLMTQSIRPRFTVQSLQEGSLARVKVHFIEKSRFTGKNKRGAFSFTVTISHVFNK